MKALTYLMLTVNLFLNGTQGFTTFTTKLLLSPSKGSDLRAQQLQSGESESSPGDKFLKKTVAAAGLCFLATLSPLSTDKALASDYGSFSSEQKVVAEAWRLVDNSFLDRTFNGKDWFQLRQTYVNQRYKSMDDAYTAIRTMVDQLGDKYTRYLSPSQYQSLVDSATGTLAGVGCEISTNSAGNVIVSDVEDGSPAKKAGIQPLDVFVEVDGIKFAKGATPDDVAIRLRGPEGSKVGVVTERNGKTQDFIITRQKITVASVKSYVSNVSGVGKVGVIRIKSFSGTTSGKVSEQFQALKKKGVNAVVVDVRGNPGGLLPGGVDTASLFLPSSKPVVFVVNKQGVVDAQSTLSDGIDLETPLVILVDTGTASAAEVFTAALQENGRASVAGEKTFGKGIVQTIRPLSDNNGGVAITVARYETPNHNDINKLGIPVNVAADVTCAKDDAASCLKASAFKSQ